MDCPRDMSWKLRVDLIEPLKRTAAEQPVREVIFSLDGVDYINSTGLGSIFALRKHLKESEARLVICDASPTIARLMKTVNLPQLITIVDDLDAAKQLLDQDGSA